jgi:hypothetical protein
MSSAETSPLAAQKMKIVSEDDLGKELSSDRRSAGAQE